MSLEANDTTVPKAATRCNAADSVAPPTPNGTKYDGTIPGGPICRPRDSIHSTVIWADTENGSVAINSAVGRLWPTNLQRDPHVTLVIQESGNSYNFVEIRGTATATTEGADEHINRLA